MILINLNAIALDCVAEQSYLKSLHVTGDVTAIDGKCLRGAYDREDNKSAIHLVSA